MQREPIPKVGSKLVDAGNILHTMASNLGQIAPDQGPCKDASQRMSFAATKMIESGNELQGIKPKPTSGKGWLKSGG